MNREIKFKVNNGFEKDKICYAAIEQSDVGIYSYWDEDEISWLNCCDVRRYTDLKDNKGIEIYEGDILKINGCFLIVKLGWHLTNTVNEIIGKKSEELYGFYAESDCGSWSINLGLAIKKYTVSVFKA